MTANLNYGEALEALKQGKMVTRKGWNGKGMFVFMMEEEEKEYDELSRSSFPAPVLDHLMIKYSESKYSIHNNQIYEKPLEVWFSPYFCLKTEDDSIIIGWIASQTDTLSDDWCILNE